MNNLLGGIGISEEQIDIANVAAVFCKDKSPVSKVRELIEVKAGYDPEVWREMAALGWMGIAIPEEYGGVGLSLTEVVPVVEHMGRALMAGPFVSTSLAAQAIVMGGTHAQKAEWLPKLASGTQAAIAMTECDGGYDPFEVSCTATLEGTRVTLAGKKILVTDADSAELIVVSVLFEGEPIFALVPGGAISAQGKRREIVVDETRASYEISLDDVTIPKSNLLDPALAQKSLRHVHLAANLLLTAEMCGGAHNCIDYTVEYLKTRKQFGKPIGAFQSLKHATVAAYCDYEKARSHLYSAAWCFDDARTGEVAVRMAKAQADKAFSYAADRAIQFHGGFGFTYECDAQLYRRRAMWCAAQYGDAIYHKAKLADLLL